MERRRRGEEGGGEEGKLSRDNGEAVGAFMEERRRKEGGKLSRILCVE